MSTQFIASLGQEHAADSPNTLIDVFNAICTHVIVLLALNRVNKSFIALYYHSFLGSAQHFPVLTLNTLNMIGIVFIMLNK